MPTSSGGPNSSSCRPTSFSPDVSSPSAAALWQELQLVVLRGALGLLDRPIRGLASPTVLNRFGALLAARLAGLHSIGALLAELFLPAGSLHQVAPSAVLAAPVSPAFSVPVANPAPSVVAVSGAVVESVGAGVS